MAEVSDSTTTPALLVLPHPSRESSLSEIRLPVVHLEPSTDLFDDEAYRTQVRRIPPALSEKDFDDDLHRQALDEGIDLPHSLDEIEATTSSMSETTMLSENTNMQGSIMSQSTAPTSCSSSERRPVTCESEVSASAQSTPTASPVKTDLQKKRNSIFRSGVRRIVGKKKRIHPHAASESPTDRSSIEQSPVGSRSKIDVDSEEGVDSVHSLKSSWSNPIVHSKASYERESSVTSPEPSTSCQELKDLQKVQLAERDRFVKFRQQLLDQINHERNDAKRQKQIAHDAAVAVKQKQGEQEVEELEEQQLQEEMKMAEEHRFWERMMHSRLRNIERFVSNPTPPPISSQPASEDGSSDAGSPPPTSPILPVRPAAGPNEYNHLAEQYREQKSLMHSHGGKINVLRGQQQRKMNSFLAQKREEIQALAQEHTKELATIDEEYDGKEKALSDVFATKRALLELYWYKQVVFEQQRQEKATGLKMSSLPFVTVAD